MSLKGLNFLHIYAQHTHHKEAFIVGNKEGLLELRAAIDEALINGQGKGDFFPSDEEGYDTYVSLIADEDEDLFNSLEMPYTEQFGDCNSNCHFVNIKKDENAPHPPSILFKDCFNNMD